MSMQHFTYSLMFPFSFSMIREELADSDEAPASVDELQPLTYEDLKHKASRTIKKKELTRNKPVKTTNGNDNQQSTGEQSNNGQK